jgi:hypothetical protein
MTLLQKLASSPIEANCLSTGPERPTPPVWRERHALVREVDFGVGRWEKLTRVETEDIPVSTDGGLKYRGTGCQPFHAAHARTTWKVRSERRCHRKSRECANLGS